jgi:hypothetical protein
MKLGNASFDYDTTDVLSHLAHFWHKRLAANAQVTGVGASKQAQVKACPEGKGWKLDQRYLLSLTLGRSLLTKKARALSPGFPFSARKILSQKIEAIVQTSFDNANMEVGVPHQRV